MQETFLAQMRLWCDEHFVIVSHFERVFTDGYVLELYFAIHEDLIDVDDGASSIDQYRLTEAWWFANSYASVIDHVDLMTIVLWRLYYLAMIKEIVVQVHDYVVDELLLTAIKELLESLYERAKKLLN